MIRPYVATKYDVEFKDFPYPTDDFLEFIEDLRTESDDVVVWSNEDDTAFELDVEALEELLESSFEPGSPYYIYTEYILNNAPDYASEVRIELF
jgi:hypothetical protein